MGDLIKRCELKTNGMLVISKPDTAKNVSAVAILRGCADDPEWLDGAAHLAEHMACRASNTYTDRQVNLLLEKLFGGSDGNDIKIYTTWTETVFGHDDLFGRAAMREAFMLMASLVHDSVLECHNMRSRLFDLRGLLVERAAVHNETRKYRDDAPRRISDLLHETLYRTNPVRRPGDSDIPQLLKLNKIGRLKQWMAGNYTPSNMATVFMGLTQAESLQWVANAELDQLPQYRSAPAADSRGDSFPQLDGIRECIVDRPGISQTHIGLGWPTESFLTPDKAALEVLARLLKARTEGLLREENTDARAGVYHPAVTWYLTRFHGLMELWFSSVGNADYLEQAQDSVLTMVRRLHDDRSTEFAEEFEAIRQNLLASVHFEFKYQPGGLLERIVTHASNGDRDFTQLESIPARLSALTPDDVRRVAAKYLDPQRFVRVVIRPVFIPQDEYDAAPPELREKYLKHLLRPAR